MSNKTTIAEHFRTLYCAQWWRISNENVHFNKK